MDCRCHSSIGRDGGEQILVLGDNCFYKGVIMHELNHAAGFFHEQSRSDRDKYVQVNWENVQDGTSIRYITLCFKYRLKWMDGKLWFHVILDFMNFFPPRCKSTKFIDGYILWWTSWLFQLASLKDAVFLCETVALLLKT